MLFQLQSLQEGCKVEELLTGLLQLYQIVFRHLCNSCQQTALNKAQFTCLMSRALEIARVPFPWGSLWLISRVTCGHSLLLLMSV